MQMDEGLDTGAMLLKGEVAITNTSTGQSVHEELAQIGGELILSVLANIDSLTPEPQDDSLATYASKLSKDEAKLDWGKSAAELDQQIRAFTPWPGSYFLWNDKTIKVISATPKPEKPEMRIGAAVVTKDSLKIVCKDSVLELDKIQMQGKKPMQIKEFLNGYKISNGEILG